MMNPILITPPDPAKPVITLAEAKAHLRIRHADDDAYIEGAIADAVDYVQGLENRVFVNQTWQQGVADFSCPVRLPFAPVSSIAVVKYSDIDNAEQTLAPANYQLSEDARSPIVTFFTTPALPSLYSRPDAVRINFVAGYGADAAAVPGASKRAVLKFMAQFYGTRGTSDVAVPSLANDGYELIRSQRRMIC